MEELTCMDFNAYVQARAVSRSENPGGHIVLGGDNVPPPPGWDRVNWSVKKWGGTCLPGLPPCCMSVQHWQDMKIENFGRIVHHMFSRIIKNEFRNILYSIRLFWKKNNKQIKGSFHWLGVWGYSWFVFSQTNNVFVTSKNEPWIH